MCSWTCSWTINLRILFMNTQWTHIWHQWTEYAFMNMSMNMSMNKNTEFHEQFHEQNIRSWTTICSWACSWTQNQFSFMNNDHEQNSWCSWTYYVLVPFYLLNTSENKQHTTFTNRQCFHFSEGAHCNYIL